MGRMKLRELINRLEELSENGKNDNRDVLVFDESTNYDITEIYMDGWVSTNRDLDFIKIEIQ